MIWLIKKITLVSSDMKLMELMLVKMWIPKLCLYPCFFFSLVFVGHLDCSSKFWGSEFTYCVKNYDMCEGINICIFNFFYSLTFVSALDIEKHIYKVFFGQILKTFFKAHISSCSNILLLLQNLDFEDNY